MTTLAENKHRLAAPTPADAKASLSKLLGDQAPRVWGQACLACSLPQGPQNMDQLEKVAEHLAKSGGMASVAGNSLKVRIRSYRGVSK